MYKYLVSLLLVVLLSAAPGSTQAQCGDVANNGGVGLDDLQFLIAYLVDIGPPPPDSTKADMDDRAGITLADLFIIVDFLFGFPVPSLDCSIDDVYHYTCSPEDTICVPFKYKIPPNINTIDLPVIVTWGPDTRSYYFPIEADGPGGNGTFAYDQFVPAKSNADFQAAGDTVYFLGGWPASVPTGLDTLGYLRYQRVAAGEGEIVSRVIDRSPVLRPAIERGDYQLYCPILIYKYPKGDVNCDTEVNVEDLSYYVDFLFKGGPEPCDPYGGP